MKHLIAALFLCLATLSHAETKPVDLWNEALRLFSTVTSAQLMNADLPTHRESKFTPRGVTLDHADHLKKILTLNFPPF